MKNKLLSIIICIALAIVGYYIFLPAINIQSIGFWLYVIYIIALYVTLNFIESVDGFRGVYNLTKKTIYGYIGCGAIIILIIIINFFLSPVFNSRSYSKRIDINEGNNFIDEIKPVDFKKIPLLDKDSSQKLGDRVMGQMPELVSQFYVSDLYTQINYNDSIVRVTPLEYNGFFKYLNNHNNGVKGYITVNSVNGESKLVKLDNGMKYMPSAILNEDLYRHLRFSYPFDVFGDETFEIDNDGKPYWIVPVMKYTGIGLKREVKSVIILDPTNGKSKKYDVGDVPSWVDHVYSADLILEQVNDWGQYKDGFLNSIFGQRNVVMTTEGYNYTVMNDDVYLYTGITSTSTDEANVGFILTNMRTKETSFYKVPGAEEYSAMASATGQVQQMNYDSTFPLLINLNNKPTYLISLKDKAGLVKMYAFVDVVDYQKVVVTDASEGINKAASNYLGNDSIKVNSNMKNKKIVVNKISNAIIDGMTYYYITDNDNNKYKASIKVSKDLLPFVEVGDELNINYYEEKEVTEIVVIE